MASKEINFKDYIDKVDSIGSVDISGISDTITGAISKLNSSKASTSVATTSKKGLMSTTDKAKIDSLNVLALSCDGTSSYQTFTSKQSKAVVLTVPTSKTLFAPLFVNYAGGTGFSTNSITVSDDNKTVTVWVNNNLDNANNCTVMLYYLYY